MGFKVLRFLKVGRYLKKVTVDKDVVRKRKVWQGISHGFHVVERGHETEDLILAQREEIASSELWLFGTFDTAMGYPIRTYLQSNIFNENLKESQIEREAIHTMKKSYPIARQRMHEGEKSEVGGFTAALIMNREKFVAANFGGHKSVLCRDGMAIQIGRKHPRYNMRCRSLIGMLHTKCLTDNGEKLKKSSIFSVTTQKVEPESEFIILGSDGIWEVMSNQEAVDLISHIEDAQSAAEILAEEAMARMSKSTISCAVIRFH